MTKKILLGILSATTLLLFWESAVYAQFGSKPITSTGKSSVKVTKPAVTTTSPPVTSTAPITTSPKPSAPGSPLGKKWFQHDSGYVILVDSDQNPGAGFREINPPVQPSGPPIQATQPTAPVANVPQNYTQPNIYTAPAPAQPSYSQIPVGQPSYAQTTPMYQAPTTPQVSSTGLPPGKKWMQHKSGYRVIVDQNTQATAEFTDIAPPAPAPSMAQGYTQGFSQPQTTMTQPSAFAAPQTYTPQAVTQPQTGPQTYSQIPITGLTTPSNTYSAQSQLSTVPPNMQRQLPYQPPLPPGMVAPQVAMQQPMGGGYGVQGAKPAIRSAPPGQKWVQSDNGMRYLVSQSTIPGPGFKELTDEEASRPVMIMPQQQQQQPQQQQSGFMSWFQNLGQR